VEGVCGVGLRAKHLGGPNLQAVLISSSSNSTYRTKRAQPTLQTPSTRARPTCGTFPPAEGGRMSCRRHLCRPRSGPAGGRLWTGTQPAGKPENVRQGVGVWAQPTRPLTRCSAVPRQLLTHSGGSAT